MKNTLLNVALFLFFSNALAQKISFNKNSINLNENLELSVTLKSEKIVKVSDFPQLEGFEKVDSSKSKHRYTVYYKPKMPGSFTIEPIKIKVNSFNCITETITINVINYSAFNDFFKNKVKKNATSKTENIKKEILDFRPKESEFLVLTVDKNEVYINEGFKLFVNLYISEDKINVLEFSDFEENYNRLLKLLKPSNCLQELIVLDKITDEKVLINGQKYIKFNLFQSFYFPIKANNVVFEPFNLSILKSKKLLGKKIEVSSNKLEIITKKPPLETNNVGVFSLKETITNNKLRPNESTKYELEIYGKGNIASLNKVQFVNNASIIEIYDLGVVKSKNNNAIEGSITCKFQLVLKTTNKVNLNDYFYWIYFNTNTQKMDTLRPRISINVKGENSQNDLIDGNQSDSFYELINTQSKKLQGIDSKDEFKKWANIGFIIMLSLTLLFIFKKNKNTQ